jgi:hypothetical protein
MLMARSFAAHLDVVWMQPFFFAQALAPCLLLPFNCRSEVLAMPCCCFDPARYDVCSSHSVAVCAQFKCFRDHDVYVRVLSLAQCFAKFCSPLNARWCGGMSAMSHRSFPTQRLRVS